MARRFQRTRMRFTQSLKVQHGRSQSDVPNSKNTFALLRTVGVGEARVTGDQVQPGSHIFRMNVYINALVPSGSGNTNFDYYIVFRRSGQTSANLPEADFSSIGLSTLRNQIIFSDLNQIGTEDAGPMKRKISIKVPKMYQRIREGDLWDLVYGHSAAVETNLGFRAKSFS